MSVKCFMVRQTDHEWRYLRRYWDGPCSAGGRGYCNAMTPIGKVQVTRSAEGYIQHVGDEHDPEKYLSDPRWPTHCTRCSSPVPETAERQIFGELIYLDDAGNEHSVRTPTPGMMWDAWWNPERWKGPDGLSLHVCCPDGHVWNIDSQASNCTMKGDVGPADSHHRCWVRHGIPPLITVDKNGHTCAAGAGSIQTPTWHGFLRNGELVT